MKFCRTVMANLSVSFSVALIIVAILNVYNPMMGFLQSKQALVLIILACLTSSVSSIASYIAWNRENYSDTEESKELK